MEFKNLALQIKPVGNECNINCSYCYANPFKKHKIKIMDFAVLEKIVKDMFSNADNITISWHGGEPTLAGVKFFQKFEDLVSKYKKPNQTLINRIQTNATNISDELAEFFHKYNFIVSVSIDGPKFLHDINRCDYNKQGTFDKTMKGVETLRKHKIDPEVIATISQTNINYPKEIFDFFYENKFYNLKLNAIYDSKTDKFSISNKMWTNFMKKIFKLWVEKSDESFHIREIDDVLKFLTGVKQNCCNGASACLQWISIDDNGDMYPCEYLRASKTYGNIKTNSFKEVLNTKNYMDFLKLFSNIPSKCKKCKLLDYCGNGCPATRVMKNRTVFDGIYVYCKYNQNMVKFVKNYINK